MKKSNFTEEQILFTLKQADVRYGNLGLLGNGYRDRDD